MNTIDRMKMFDRMDAVEFARGGMAKAAPKAGKAGKPGVVEAVVNAVTGGGSAMNGTVNGKRGFQPGNTYGTRHGGKGGSASVKAAGKHRSARSVVAKHVKAGTVNTPEGRAAVRVAAHAHRELQAARSASTSARSATAKADRAVASGRASSLASKPSTPTPSPAPTPTIKARVEKSAKEASGVKVDTAATHLGDLHAGAKAGALKPTDIHAHVERVARGTTKDELFAAAKKAGIEHKATTKKALVEHLKQHAQGLSKPAEPAKVAPAPHGPEGDLMIRDTIAAAVHDPSRLGDKGFLPGLGDHALVKIHALRDHVEAAHGKIAPDRFDRIVKEARAEGHLRTHAVSDNRDLTSEQHARSIRGFGGETLGYLTPGPQARPPVAAAIPKKADRKKKEARS